MAQQTINTGTAPNDGTGDTLKTSFTKCNANFTELYTGTPNSNYVLKSGDTMSGALTVTMTDGMRFAGAAGQGQIVAQGPSADVSLALTAKGNAGITFYNANFSRPCATFLSVAGADTSVTFGAQVGYVTIGANPGANPVIFASPVQVPANSTAVTPTAGDSSTKIATTAFVATSAPAKTSFSANRTADQTGVANEAVTKVAFTATSFNDSGLFNTTTNRWTPPAGKCQLSAGVRFNAGLLLGTPILIYIHKNGAPHKFAIGACVSSLFAGSTISIVDACNGTDYYEVYVFIYTSTTATIAGISSTDTWFTGTTL